MLAFQHRFAVVDGVELHWAEAGHATEHPPLVLIHGLTDSHLTWRKIVADMARDRLVLMIDLPGCGLSGRPNASYGLEWQATLVAAWLAQLQLSRVQVVGHSYGGGVSQMLLLACPERIDRIVLAAAGGLGRDVGFWLKFGTFPFFVEHMGQPFMAFSTRRALPRLIQRHRKLEDMDEIAKQDIQALAAMNAKPGTARAFSRTVRDVINFGGQTRHFLQRAREVTTFPPVAVFWGEQDMLIPIRHAEEFVAKTEGAVFKAFADCGHYLHHEQPAAFATALRDFLDNPRPTPVTLR